MLFLRHAQFRRLDRRVNLVTNPSFPKQLLPFHSFINCFWFIPINNTDADLAALHCITNCYLNYQVALTVHAAETTYMYQLNVLNFIYFYSFTESFCFVY
jgi:hypothetical protein